MKTFASLTDNQANFLKKRINNLNGYKFDCHRHEKERLIAAIRRLTVDRKSGSLIVYGSSGFGRKTLLDHCLAHCHGEKSKRPFKVFRLNALINPTDCASLNSITKFLGLSDNLSASAVGEELEAKFTQSKEAYVFVLQRFELFCRNQETLLYVLLDIIQRVDNFLLIGVTTRNDCVINLEKRCNSRLSTTFISLKCPFKSIDDYLSKAKELLCDLVNPEYLRPVFREHLIGCPSFPQFKNLLLNCLSIREKLSDPPRDDAKTIMSILTDMRLPILQTLTPLELGFVCMFGSHFKHNDRSHTVRISDVYSESRQIKQLPDQIFVSQNLAISVVDRLIHYDIVQIASHETSTEVYLDHHTDLKLNVSINDINHVLQLRKNDLPTKFDELFA